MPRYFFHLRNDVAAHDDEGTDLPDIEAARAFAIENIRSVATEHVISGTLNLDDRIEIADHDGTVIDVITFGDAIAVSGRASECGR